MRLKSTLGKSWRLWGHWNNLKELLDLFGWKDWLRAWILQGSLSLVSGGVLGMFVGAVSIGSPIGVLIAALVVGLIAAAISFVISLNRALSRLAATRSIATGSIAVTSEIHISDASGTSAAGSGLLAAPSITAKLHSEPMKIDGLDVACAIRVENRTGEYLHERCLVKLLEMSCHWPPSMPRDFVLRTESQILGRRSGRFNMAIGDKKTVPILFQDHPRKDFLIVIDENIDSRPVATREQSKHRIPFPIRRPRIEMVIETSGAALPGRYLLTLTKGKGWMLIPELHLVAGDYTLPQTTSDLHERSVADSRLPLLEFLGLAEREFGWRIRAQTGYDLLDLLYGLRQAGADRTVIFWGKTTRNRAERLIRNEPLGVINKAHWVDYELDVLKALQEHDNFYICTLNKGLHSKWSDGGFADIHVDEETGMKWLCDVAHRYRGHTGK